MKVNMSTNTDSEVFKVQKKLSLKPLFLPKFRYQLLIENFLNSLNNPSFVNNEVPIDFSNKSIFVYNYTNRNYSFKEKNKSNSVKNIKYEGIEKNKIKNKCYLRKHLSVNKSLNNKKYINNNINKNMTNNIDNINTYLPKFGSRYIKSKGKTINKSRNNNTNPENYFLKTSLKKNPHIFYFKKRDNISDIKERLYFKSTNYLNEGKGKVGYNFFNFFGYNKNKIKCCAPIKNKYNII